MKAEGRRQKVEVERNFRHSTSAIRHGAAAAFAAALAGCGTHPHTIEGNYLTYEHAFTDAATEAARKNAEATCRWRSLVAVSTSRACSLTQCTTSYQCVNEKPVTLPAEPKKK
jgi:hypothetical protein